MNAYQNFLDFFSMHNKERLDGLNESYFAPMTEQERQMAFDYLLSRVKAGGTAESVNGLFRADPNQATEPVRHLLESGLLNGEAQIAAAWNLYKIKPEAWLLSVFIRFLSSQDSRLREAAVYYLPENTSTDTIKNCLQGMIRTETEQLPRIHAVDKLFALCGVSEESVGKNLYLNLYRNLHSNDINKKEIAFMQLEKISK